MIHFFLVGLLGGILLFAGCSISGNITDFKRSTTRVSSLKIEKSNKLVILDGGAQRQVKLKNIRNVSLQPEVSKTFHKQLFYLAVISFKDGTSIGSFEEGKKQTYVAVDKYLFGKSGGGIYRVLLSDISKLEIISR